MRVLRSDAGYTLRDHMQNKTNRAQLDVASTGDDTKQQGKKLTARVERMEDNTRVCPKSFRTGRWSENCK